jgi:hypothetical protein
MNINEKSAEDKGADWLLSNFGHGSPKSLGDTADLIYFHFRDSEEGELAWSRSDVPEEDKVDVIVDEIHDRYVGELGWMTDDEWALVSDEIYGMVYDGVF